MAGSAANAPTKIPSLLGEKAALLVQIVDDLTNVFTIFFA